MPIEKSSMVKLPNKTQIHCLKIQFHNQNDCDIHKKKGITYRFNIYDNDRHVSYIYKS